MHKGYLNYADHRKTECRTWMATQLFERAWNTLSKPIGLESVLTVNRPYIIYDSTKISLYATIPHCNEFPFRSQRESFDAVESLGTTEEEVYETARKRPETVDPAVRLLSLNLCIQLHAAYCSTCLYLLDEDEPQERNAGRQTPRTGPAHPLLPAVHSHELNQPSHVEAFSA